MTVGVNTVGIAEEWLGGLSTGDFDAVDALFDTDVEMRALLPDGPHKYNGREEVTGRLKWWFGSGGGCPSVHAEAGVVEDRVELSYGFRILNAVEGAKPGWHLIEQRAFCDVGTTIERMHLVCSGFRSILEATQLHRFDAGEAEAVTYPSRPLLEVTA